MRHPFLKTLAGSGVTTDPNFENVTLLLHGDGTNGGQNNTFVDGSTNNFTITRNGNTTQGTFSPYGDNWSNYFDGNGDFLTTPDNAAFDFGTGDFTIEAWIYIAGNSAPDNDTNRRAGIFSTYPASSTLNDAYLLDVYGTSTTTGTGLSFASWQSGSVSVVQALSTTISQQAWHHIAVARSGTTTRLFLDGNQIASGTLANQNVNCANTVKIGRTGYTGYISDFNGYISNLRVLKGTAQYTGSYTVPTAPLTAITNTSLLTCQSNRFRDASTNNFTITRNGDVSVQRFSPFSPTAAYAAGTIGGSGYFDGTGDWLSAADNAAFTLGSGDFTLELWAYFQASGLQIFAGQNSGSASTSSIDIRFNSGTISANAHVGSTGYSASGSGVTSCWNHIAWVRDGTTLRLYVNGTQVGTNTSISTQTINDSSSVFGIGRVAGGFEMTGYLSDVRLLKGTCQYPSGTAFTPPTAPLTAITNTSLLLNFTNAAILDNAMMAVPETVGNAQISTSVKKYGTGSLYFDGTGDYLIAAQNESLVFRTGDFTVEYWLYPVSNTSGTMVDLRSALSGAGAVAFSDYFNGAGKYGLYFDGNTYLSTSTISTNQWTHIAVTRSGTNLRVFLNGTQDGSTVTNSQNLGGGVLRVGVNINVSQFLNGYIDDLRVTKGVARYTANFTPPTAALPDL